MEIRLDDIVPGLVQDEESGSCRQEYDDEDCPAVEVVAPSEPVGSSGQGIESHYHINRNQSPFVGQENHNAVQQRGVPAVYGCGQRPVKVQDVVNIDHYLCSVSQMRSLSSWRPSPVTEEMNT